QIDAGEANPSLLGIVEAEQQPGDGRLAASGPPEQPQHLARRQTDRDFVEDRLVKAVAKRPPIDLHGERSGRPRRRPALWIPNGAALGEQRPDAGDAGDRLLEILELASDVLDRPVEQDGVAVKQEDGPDTYFAELEQVGTDAERYHDPQHPERVHPGVPGDAD